MHDCAIRDRESESVWCLDLSFKKKYMKKLRTWKLILFQGPIPLSPLDEKKILCTIYIDFLGHYAPKIDVKSLTDARLFSLLPLLFPSSIPWTLTTMDYS